jgi:hypothetical protein
MKICALFRSYAWIVFLVFAVGLTHPLTAVPPASDICPVHGVRMESKALRIVYGMPSPREFEEMRIAKTRFPHGRDFVLGGCVVRPAKTVEGFICPKCVLARKVWLEENKR